MTWDYFSEHYSNWAESTLRSRISSLTDIGSSESVLAVMEKLPSDKLQQQLLRKALKLGATFQFEQTAESTNSSVNSVHSKTEKFNVSIDNNSVKIYHHSYNVYEASPLSSEYAFDSDTARDGLSVLLGLLFVLFLIIFGFFGLVILGVVKFSLGYCGSSASSCSHTSHYGYRYGRWYYGTGHRYGCRK